mmetsp:Transcript_14006/g.34218  ORF Transcript_14006/g.34218 Transcript_14006/m.34218 type:complete len:329 (-) Transcript_14006:412-1398(-)
MSEHTDIMAQSIDSAATTVGPYSPLANDGDSREAPSRRKPSKEDFAASKGSEFAHSEKVLGRRSSTLQDVRRANSMPAIKREIRRPPALTFVKPLTLDEDVGVSESSRPFAGRGAGELWRAQAGLGERKSSRSSDQGGARTSDSATRSTSREASRQTSMSRGGSRCQDIIGASKPRSCHTLDGKPCSPGGSRKLKRIFRLASWRSKKEPLTATKTESPRSINQHLAPLPPGSKAPAPSPASTKWSEMKRKYFSFLRGRIWSKVTGDGLSKKKRQSLDSIFLRRPTATQAGKLPDLGPQTGLGRSQSESTRQTKDLVLPPIKKSASSAT